MIPRPADAAYPQVYDFLKRAGKITFVNKTTIDPLWPYRAPG